MADEADSASAIEEHDREVAIRAIVNRARIPTPICAECGEANVFTTSTNVQWRVCLPCGEHLRAIHRSKNSAESVRP